MSEAIARQIEKQIHQGRLQPDEMLPPKNDLMKQFGVGRNTVREALRMLEASGLLKIKRGGQGGAIITHMSNEFVSDFLAKAFRLGGLSGRAFHDFRIAVEPSIAEIVAGEGEVVRRDPRSDGGQNSRGKGPPSKQTSLRCARTWIFTSSLPRQRKT